MRSSDERFEPRLYVAVTTNPNAARGRGTNTGWQIEVILRRASGQDFTGFRQEVAHSIYPMLCYAPLELGVHSLWQDRGCDSATVFQHILR